MTGGYGGQCDQALLVEGEWRCDDFMKLLFGRPPLEAPPAMTGEARPARLESAGDLTEFAYRAFSFTRLFPLSPAPFRPETC
jgi:hypothetical protein